jgi:hypothetical protein
MESRIRQAVEHFKTAAYNIDEDLDFDQVTEHLRNACHQVLDLLDDESEIDEPVSKWDRQSREIAAELRRVERLMKRNMGSGEE